MTGVLLVQGKHWDRNNRKPERREKEDGECQIYVNREIMNNESNKHRNKI